ncbi:MAG: LysE family transporter [Chlorobi bacterium]|nr:LysE family transporter [Chlorobiota bacterium]
MYVGDLLIGALAGFALAIPPGPISIAVMKQALEGNGKIGAQIGVGAAFADMLLATLAAFASSAFVDSLLRSITSYGWLVMLVQIGCIVALIFLARSYFQATSQAVVKSAAKGKKQEERAQNLGLQSPIALGALLGIMNIASPTFLPTLTLVIGSLRTNSYLQTVVGASTTDNIILAVGFGCGVFLWFFVLLQLLIKFRSRIPTNFIGRVYRFAGWAFVLFAVILAYKVATSTDWGNIW